MKVRHTLHLQLLVALKTMQDNLGMCKNKLAVKVDVACLCTAERNALCSCSGCPVYQCENRVVTLSVCLLAAFKTLQMGV